MMERGTIAAISTPQGTGGIGIIKISGSLALTIGKKVFHKKSRQTPVDNTGVFFQSHRFYYGHIIDPDTDDLIDEVLIVFMKSPGSYTREDIIEIHSHSGRAVLQAILSLVLDFGAELAQPGEFTRRAFLNGRIDLTQAEAVMDIINAKSKLALDIAAAQLKGALKERIMVVRNELLKIQVVCEAFIDFPEDMDDAFETSETLVKLKEWGEKPLRELLSNYENGHVIREGIKIAIIGKPNVGKSSLMNRMLEKERVLVTDIPGTTRDMIEETINIHGVTVLLADTAGLHQAADPVEAMGIRKTDECINNADLIIFMKDASVPMDENDHRIYKQIKHKKHIIVRNKIDIAPTEGSDTTQWKNINEIDVSVLRNAGIKGLKKKIFQTVAMETAPEGGYKIIPNLRQKKMIEKAARNITDAITSIEEGVFLELVVFDIKDAINNLNHVLGVIVDTDVQEKIFDQFCVGK